METARPKFAKLADKMKVLMDEYVQLKEALQHAHEENARMVTSLEYESRIRKNLEDQVKSLKLAKGLGGEQDRSELKGKLDEYIHDIDRCIALLNNQ